MQLSSGPPETAEDVTLLPTILQSPGDRTSWEARALYRRRPALPSLEPPLPLRLRIEAKKSLISSYPASSGIISVSLRIGLDPRGVETRKVVSGGHRSYWAPSIWLQWHLF